MENNYLLDTSNEHCFVYIADDLRMEILGGVRIDLLDRMRVTIKIALLDERISLSVRHNLDLYNDVQVEKLVRKTAEKLEVGSIVISRAVEGLIDQLEKYRLNELENSEQESSKKKLLTEAETLAVTEFLKKHDLLQLTNDYIGKSGVIGEENNRLLMYLIFTSRKREQP